MRPVHRIGAGLMLAVVAGAVAPARAANDPYQSKQWGMTVIGAETAWKTATGRGVTIAVVDTGVDLNHEDLKDKLTVLPGANFVNPDQTPQDDYSHGTHVAGIAAALTNNGLGVVGVAPDAKIMPVKVLDNNGSGSGADVEAGIRFAVDHGAQVINLSLGDRIQPLVPGDEPAFAGAVEYAWAHQAICVIAAGNNFVTGSGFANEPAIIVSATDRNDAKAVYSSDVGAAHWGIAAPGGAGTNPLGDANDIYSTYWRSSRPNNYKYDAGTSMATPHVAGAAAVLRSMGLTPQQTVDRLLATAKDLGATGPDTTFGYGRLDLAKAVSSAPASPPTSTSTAKGTATTQPATRPTGGSPGAPAGAPVGASTPTAGAPNAGSPSGPGAAPDALALPQPEGGARAVGRKPPAAARRGHRSTRTGVVAAALLLVVAGLAIAVRTGRLFRS